MFLIRKSTLKRLLALAINVQFILPTVGYAQPISKNGENTYKVLNTINQLGASYIQGMQQVQQQQMSQQQLQTLKNNFGVRQVDPNQVPPIFSQSGCIVLDARNNKPSDMCEADKFDPDKAKSGYYTALMNLAEDNENDLTNFLTPGHERDTAQGVGCYDKAVKQMDQLLKSRIETLNKLEADLEDQIKAFQKLAEQDLEQIKQGQALLTGTPAEYLRDIRFEDKFNDTACKSIFRNDTFKTQGQRGGYASIEELLDRSVNPEQGMGPSDLKTKSQDIKRDIMKIASRASQYASDSDTMTVNPSDLRLRTSLISGSNASLNAVLEDLRSEANQASAKLQKDTLAVVQDRELSDLMAQIDNNTLDVDTAIFNYERRAKNTCLNTYLEGNFGGIDGFANSLEDPNVSKKLNREGDSYFKNTIQSILSDDEYTMEEKLSRIQREEAKNNRFSLQTGKSLNIRGQRVGASTRLRASNMIQIFADNCKQKYNSQNVSNGSSRKDMTTALKRYSSRRKAIQKSFVAKLESQITDEMVNCPSITNVGTAVNSCEDALDTNSQNFCLRTANLCADNMLACQDKANKIVETTKAEQKVVADRYKANMDQLKVQMVQQFSLANKAMEESSRQLDGLYQLGSIYEVPVGLSLDLLEGNFMTGEGYDKALRLEDPQAYLSRMKADIAKLKTQVAESNDQIMRGTGTQSEFPGLLGEVAKYKQNYQAMQSLWANTKAQCLARIKQYNGIESQRVAEANQQANERNAKVQAACRKLAQFEENPIGFCGDASELAEEVAEIAAAVDTTKINNIGKYGALCDEFGAQDSTTHDPTGSSDYSLVSSGNVKDFCEKNKEFSSCDSLKEQLKKMNKNKNKGEPDRTIASACVPVDQSREVEPTKNEVKKFFSNNKDEIRDSYCLTKAGLKNKSGGECPDGELEVTSLNINIIKDIKKVYAGQIVDQDSSDNCPDNKDISINRVAHSHFVNIQKQVLIREQQLQLSEMGGVKISACNSTFDNGIGKELQNAAGQLGQINNRVPANAMGY